ncbi:MAG TPA: bacillithiol biosynthesis cysteine-adding enzyme BshC [Balneolaceae bacterium]
MQTLNYPLDHLPFSKLFKTYINNFEKLGDFFEVNPFSEKEIARKIEHFQFKGNRRATAEILAAFNKKFDVNQAALDNIERLKDEDALAIVTGQQLGVYGGPIYTVLKAISAIHLARQMEQRFERPVIPVFWLADEDHDYDEIRRLYLLENDELKQFELPPKTNHLAPVAELQVPLEVDQLRSDVRKSLHKTEFFDDLWQLLDKCFTPKNTFLDASGRFMAELFSKHGLILAGSNLKEVKELTGEYLKESIAGAGEIRKNLEQQTKALSSDFHQQVHLHDSNLFYLDDEAGRSKISSNGNGWQTDNGKKWQTQELLEAIATRPENFSPNVFLRPVLQDALLPALGYVAGPGEIAYYGQMKKMYHSFGLEMPVIFPRLSATIVEPAIDRVFKELPFEFYEYDNRIEDLETAYVDRTEQIDIKVLFDEWKEKVSKIADPEKQKIADIDFTLKASADKATSLYFNELDALKTKVYRAVKKRDEIQLKRIRRIQTHLFPGNGLQERSISTIFYMNQYGLDIWDKVLNSLNEDEAFDHHKLLYL